jgi:hypothetical protein
MANFWLPLDIHREICRFLDWKSLFKYAYKEKYVSKGLKNLFPNSWYRFSRR